MPHGVAVPVVRRVALDGTLPSEVTIPVPIRTLQVIPTSDTISLQVAFAGGKGNTAGEFVTLRGGRSLTLEPPRAMNDHPTLGPLTLSIFAAAATTVELLWLE